MTAIDLNLPNNSEFTKNTQDGSKTLQWKNYATEKNYKDYNLVITDVLGGEEVKSSYGGNLSTIPIATALPQALFLTTRRW